VMAAIDAQQQFWLSESALAATLTGRPVDAAGRFGAAASGASPGEAAGH